MKNPKVAVYSFVFLIIIAVNIWFRLYPQFLPGLDKNGGGRLKNFYRDNSGQSYLLEIDGYGWGLEVQHVLEKGIPGTSIKNNQIWDDYSLAPVGVPVNNSQGFIYASAYIYKTLCFVFGSLNFDKFLFYLPLFYTLIFLFFIFYVCRYFFGTVCGFFALIFVGLCPIVIQRTCAGWFDTDTFNIFFSLLIVFCAARSVDAIRLPGKIFWTFCVLAALALFSSSWCGWWYAIGFYLPGFLMIVMVDGYRFVFKRTLKLSEWGKNALIFLGVLFLVGFMWVFWSCRRFGAWPWHSFSSFYSYFTSYYFHLKSYNNSSIWPNPFTIIVEYSWLTWGMLDMYLPGKFFAFAAVGASVGGICYYWKRPSRNFVIFLFIWFCIALAMAIQAARFLLFAWVPAGIFLAMFFSQIVFCLNLFIRTRNFIEKKIFYSVIVGGIVLVSFFTFIKHADRGARILIPAINRDWVSALEYLRGHTPANSVINTWWDSGDWFKYIARRRTVIDGQNQMRPASYWMARAFLSTSENEVMNILRMLNNASDTLFDDIHYSLGDDFRAIAFLDAVVKSDRASVAKVFDYYNVPGWIQKRVIDVVYTPPTVPAYFVVDTKTIGKMYSISKLGSWDFVQLYVDRHAHADNEWLVKNISSSFNISYPDAQAHIDAYRRKSNERDPFFLSSYLEFRRYIGETSRTGDIITFSDFAEFNTSEKEALVFSPPGHRSPANDIYIFDKSGLNRYQYTYPSKLSDTCLFLAGKKWKMVLASQPGLTLSLISRLYFMHGYGLAHFKLFKDGEQDGIFVYEISWQ